MNTAKALAMTLVCSTLALIGATAGCEPEERPAAPPPVPEEQTEELPQWPQQPPRPPEPEGDQPDVR